MHKSKDCGLAELDINAKQRLGKDCYMYVCKRAHL
jgi:hypothetical protein